MDDIPGRWAGFGIGVGVRRAVMLNPLLKVFGTREINVVDVRPKLIDLRWTDAWSHSISCYQSQFALSFGERNPQTTPGTELALWSPQQGHRPPGVPRH